VNRCWLSFLACHNRSTSAHSKHSLAKPPKKISKRKISKKPLINIGRVGLVALIFALLLSALKIEPAKALVGNNPIRVFGQNDNFNDTRANGVGVSGAGLNYPVQMDLDSSGVGAISG